MKDQRDEPHEQLDGGVPEQRRSHPTRSLSDEMRAERHAAQEDHEHDDLGVRAVSDEKTEIAGPDGLVDESSGSAEDEHRDECGDQSVGVKRFGVIGR